MMYAFINFHLPRDVKEYFCMNCLQGFKEESSRDEHLDYCINNEWEKVEMAHNNLIVQFQMVNSNLRFHL